MAGQLDRSLRQVPQSHVMGVSALLMALGLHVTIVLQNQANPVQQAGGNTAMAAHGTSFANLAVGVETPEEADPSPQALTASPARPLVPLMAPPAAPPLAKAAASEVLELTSPIAPVQGGVPLVPVSAKPPLEPSAQPPVTAPLSQSVAQPTSPSVPDRTEAGTAVELVQPVTANQAPRDAANPVLQASVDAAREGASSPKVDLQDALEPVPAEVQNPEPQSPPVVRSLRPPERPVEASVPAASEAAARSVTKPIPKSPPASQPRGNGEVNANRGLAKATRSAAGGQAVTSGGTAKVQGNAAADNYSGLVMRRIQRAKRQASVRGEALVRFKITAGGGLAGLSIARSSGSGKLDGIALAQVRRAAPFPPPPPGARTSFSVRIKGN